MSGVNPTNRSGARSGLAGLVLSAAMFTLLGSLVPFEFRIRTWADVTSSFVWAMSNRIGVQSRSDALANVMLGIPLGFGLLGVVGIDRVISWQRMLLWGVTILLGCLAFAAAVEFAQLYVPARTCAGSDVLAQGLGALLGMAVWLGTGQRLIDELRQALGGNGTAMRFLVAYLMLMTFIQALPLDLSLSPADAYRKFRDGGVKLIPFAEFSTLHGNSLLRRIANLFQLAALYLPAGLLASQLPGRFWAMRNRCSVFLAALGLALIVETGQVLVKSRVSTATDMVVGGSAAFFGWLIGHGFQHGVSWIYRVVLFSTGVAVLLWVGLHPFEPGPRVRFDWVPGMPLGDNNPLLVLEESLTKLVMFGLLGVVVAEFTRSSIGFVPTAAVLVGLLTAAVIELGQTRLVGHTPGITDVLLGGLGAFSGAWVAGRMSGGHR